MKVYLIFPLGKEHALLTGKGGARRGAGGDGGWETGHSPLFNYVKKSSSIQGAIMNFYSFSSGRHCRRSTAHPFPKSLSWETESIPMQQENISSEGCLQGDSAKGGGGNRQARLQGQPVHTALHPTCSSKALHCPGAGDLQSSSHRSASFAGGSVRDL